MTQRKIIHLNISGSGTDDLRGRQSVRTTFKLPERYISALSVLASQLGIKQKSLFDHLVEDVEALKDIARDFDELHAGSQRVAKTYVISRRTLENLEHVASNYNTPRDILVEYSIERILPLIDQEKQKHDERKKLQEEVEAWYKNGLTLYEKSSKALGSDDPATHELYSMVKAAGRAFENLQDMVEKGREIEKF